MSLFGSLMGDFDDDFMGNHMNAMNMQMRSMNRLMNSFMPDPFNMLAASPFDNGMQHNSLVERNAGQPMNGFFGFPAMPNMNRLLSPDMMGGPSGASYCSSSVISMSSGPDGRPQVYQATSSTKTGPGGVRETRKTVQDSRSGLKKMAIGHHIGDRAHIIEKEQDLNSGQLEEHQEFINLEEEEAEDFDREFTTKVRGSAIPAIRARQALTIEPLDDDDQTVRNRRQLPALPAPIQQQPQQQMQQPSLHNSPMHHVMTSSPYVNASANYAHAAAADFVHNNNYVNNTPRRHYRNHQHFVGAMPRRSLRTPSSSPLTMNPPTFASNAAALSDWRIYNPWFYRN